MKRPRCTHWAASAQRPDRHTRRTGRAPISKPGRRLALLAILLPALLPVAAGASQPAESERGTPQGIREETMWSTGNIGMGMWFWPEGDRAYQLAGSFSGQGTVRAYDTRTREEVASTELIPPAWGTGPEINEYSSGGGRPHLGAVDRDNGRFFVGYRKTVQDVSQDGAPCTGSGSLGDPGCVGGLHVLDGLTLEPLGKMPYSTPTVEGPRLQPILRTVAYAPADEAAGWGGRVLTVIEEVATGPLENSVVPALSTQIQNTTPRRNSGNIAYAVAFDPDTMRQEWAVRLEGCRNSREPRRWHASTETHPTAIFRTSGPNPALYVGCHGNATQQGVVVRVPLNASGMPASAPVTITPSALNPDDPGTASGVVAPAARQEVFAGPDHVRMVLADPASRRILMRVEDSGEVWWVFDGHENQFVGTIGIGDYRQGHTTAAIDPDVGRLYVVAADPTEVDATGPGGLYIADIRRRPLPQALFYPEFADPPRGAASWINAGGDTMSLMPRAGRGSTMLVITTSRRDGANLRVLLDSTPVSMDPPRGEEAVRTLDVQEADGVTEATFDGTARGFGFRAILIGGAEGATRAGSADPVGLARGARDFDSHGSGLWDQTLGSVERGMDPLPPNDPCADAQRELIVAFVGPQGPAVVDASSSRGEAQPILVDTRTRDDLGTPVSRCGPSEWEELWQKALMSRAPMEEPAVDWPFAEARSSCTATEEDVDDSWNDPVAGMFASRVSCSEKEVGGWGQARGVGVEDISVASTLSSFRIYRDADRGMVARVESIARGVDIGGLIRIDTIRGAAESWANGRTAPEPDPEALAGAAEAFNPFNCDSERPAGTCFQRHIFGVTVMRPGGQGVAYRCGPCGPEEDFLEAMNRALGAYGYARFREPDSELARGSDDGYIAAVTKRSQERFADIVLNNDLLETMVPMLEVVRYAPHNRPTDPGGTPAWSTGTPPRGRQVYQFAAVEVSSTYSIQCLLVYDADTNTCAAAPSLPGAVVISLQDAQGEPLAGGAFEVRSDVDEDGVAGLADVLLPDGTCVTADDGIGTCSFGQLHPGAYLVTQVAAPAGYARSEESFPVQVASGEQRTVVFTNTADASAIHVTAEDAAGAPVAGAAFAVYADPDSDGRVAGDAQPVATCTTDESGVCSMVVPAGSYVLAQTGAPDGLAPIEPIAFTFASAGQTAAISIVNYPPGDVDAPQPAQSAVPVYSEQATAPPTSTVTGYRAPAPEVAATERGTLPEEIGGTVVKVIRAPGDALRLLSRDPQQVVAWTAAIALLALAVLAVQRRRVLTVLTATPVLAFSAPPSAARRSMPPARQDRSHRRSAPPVMGAAPSPLEAVRASVLLATASPVLAQVVSSRLGKADRVTLVDSVRSLHELRAAIAARKPDVVMLDLNLPGARPTDVCEIVARLHPPQRVIALVPSGSPVESTIPPCVEAGLGGVLAVDGDIGNGHLAYAVLQVAAGKPCYGPSVQAALRLPEVVRQLGPKRGRPRIADLTEREREVAEMAAEGLSRYDIADRLCLSPWTVKRHLQSVRSKLGVLNPRDRSELRRRLAERAEDSSG